MVGAVGLLDGAVVGLALGAGVTSVVCALGPKLKEEAYVYV
jgi:hypothetical protein